MSTDTQEKPTTTELTTAQKAEIARKEAAAKTEKARFAARLKKLRIGDIVFFFQKGNRGKGTPMPATVLENMGNGSLKLVAQFMRSGIVSTIPCDGAMHWKHESYEQFPTREANVPSWAFRDEFDQ